MKTIGLLGGTRRESSIVYERIRAARQRVDPALLRMHDLPGGHLTTGEHPTCSPGPSARSRRAEGNQPS